MSYTMKCSSDLIILIFIFVVLFPFGITPVLKRSTTCNSEEQSSIHQSSISLRVEICENFDMINIPLCHPVSGSFSYCTPLFIEQKHKSNVSPGSPLDAKETSTLCFDENNRTCSKTFHRQIDVIIDSARETLNIGLTVSLGNNITLISHEQCLPIDIDVCEIHKMGFNKTSSALSVLLRKHRVTNLTLFGRICKCEYLMNSQKLHLPKYLEFSSSIEGLVPFEVFSHILSLEVIDIQNITLRSLPPNIFQRNIKLRICIIKNTMLETIPSGLFKSSIDLTTVILSDNRLETLPKWLFGSNPRLSHLDLARNRIKYLPKNLILSDNNLRVLDLSHNQLQNLNPLGFSEKRVTNRVNTNDFSTKHDSTNKRKNAKVNDGYFNQRQNIDILNKSTLIRSFSGRHNKGIKNLSGSFPFPNFHEFLMSDCSISNIDKDFFAIPSHNESLFITKIEMSRNQLTTLHSNTFSNCHKLRILLLDENKLTTLKKGLFKNLINLEHLNVSGNMFSILQHEAFNLRNIKIADFSWNPIQGFDIQQMPYLFRRDSSLEKFINLSHNCLAIKKSTLTSMDVTPQLFLKLITLKYKLLETKSSKKITKKLLKEKGSENLLLTLNIIIGPIEDGTLLCPNPFEQFCIHFPRSCESHTNISPEVIDEKHRRWHLLNCTEQIFDAHFIKTVIAEKCPTDFQFYSSSYLAFPLGITLLFIFLLLILAYRRSKERVQTYGFTNFPIWNINSQINQNT